MEGPLQTFFFSLTSNLNRTLLKNISTELSILCMLFWQEKIKIKIREKILMICFIFYLNCLNDKEKGLKFLIYKKIQIPVSLGIWILTYFKENPHSY